MPRIIRKGIILRNIPDRRSTIPLVNIAKYLVAENRASLIPNEDRLSMLKAKNSSLLVLLSYLGFLGGFLYSLKAFVSPPTITVLGSLVVEDHASGVIYDSLTRVFGSRIDSRGIIRRSPSRLCTLWVLVKNIGSMFRAYRKSATAHVVERVRLFQLFCFYNPCEAFLKSYKPDVLLLMRTNDPKRLALGAAAEKIGIPVITYVVERLGVRQATPFKVHTQLGWTKKQVSQMRLQGTNVVQMPTLARGIRITVPEAGNAICGVLLNAKCDLLKVKEFLNDLKELHKVSNIRIRPHPGFSEDKLTILKGYEICDWRHSLESFLDKVDMVFAPNTNAIVEALLYGVPVVYLGGPDGQYYDLHNFVKNGIIVPYTDTFHFPSSIIDFYQSDFFKDHWRSSDLNNEFTTDGTAEKVALSKILENFV